MRAKLKNVISGLFLLIFILFNTLSPSQENILYAAEYDNSIFMKKVSKSYTKKFCNAIGFGLSKESAMNFSFEENKQVYKQKKEIKDINKESLAEQIAISVVEQCGYPINLSGEEGILEFKSYYLSKDQESSNKKE